MTHWRMPNSELPTPAMILWRRCVIALAGTLIGGGLAMLVWGFA